MSSLTIDDLNAPTDSDANHADLLEAAYNLAYLIECTTDPAKIAEYIVQLSTLRPKLIAVK